MYHNALPSMRCFLMWFDVAGCGLIWCDTWSRSCCVLFKSWQFSQVYSIIICSQVYAKMNTNCKARFKRRDRFDEEILSNKKRYWWNLQRCMQPCRVLSLPLHLNTPHQEFPQSNNCLFEMDRRSVEGRLIAHHFKSINQLSTIKGLGREAWGRTIVSLRNYWKVQLVWWK